MRENFVLGAIVTAALLAIGYQNRTAFLARRDPIVAEAELNKQECVRPGQDVLLTIANKSNHRIDSVELRVTSFRAGHSDPLSSAEFRSDKIMELVDSEQYCMMRPGLHDPDGENPSSYPFADPYGSVLDSDLRLSVDIKEVTPA